MVDARQLCRACAPPAAGREAPQHSADAGDEAKSPKPRRSAAQKPAEPVFKEVTLPAGTTLRLELKSAVASDTSKVEDTFAPRCDQAGQRRRADGAAGRYRAGGHGHRRRGSGRVKGRARIAYRFNSLAPRQRSVTTSGPRRSRTRPQPTKKKDATKIAIGAGAGAALGAILGGGSGAAKGAAIGGGGGTGACSPREVRKFACGPGADVTTRLTAPLTVRVKAVTSRRVCAPARARASPSARVVRSQQCGRLFSADRTLQSQAGSGVE